MNIYNRLFLPGKILVLFGASKFGEEAVNILKENNVDVHYFCDNDKTKWGKTFCNVLVLSPTELSKLDKDINLLITSVYAMEIKCQLVDYGFKNIYSYTRIKANGTHSNYCHSMKSIYGLVNAAIYRIDFEIESEKPKNYLARVNEALGYYVKKIEQLLDWGFISNEETNYTYDLTEANTKYLAHTISIITGCAFNDTLKYIDEPLHDQQLREYIINAIKKSEYKETSDLKCGFGRRLGWYAFARIIKPRIIVETGVDKGLGSVLLCSALLKNQEEGHPGKYYGTDINPHAGWMLNGEYKNVGQVLYGDSIRSLKDMDEQIDLFINDSDHSPEYEFNEYITIKDKLSKNAVILGDNSHYSDKLSEFSLLTHRNFLFFQERPKDHWYPGAGIGISYRDVERRD